MVDLSFIPDLYDRKLRTIEDMPDVIWVRRFDTHTGGTWYDIEPTAEMFASYSSFRPFHKYIKDDVNAEIFCWNQTSLDKKYHLRGWFRLERHPQLNQTVGYRKAE